MKNKQFPTYEVKTLSDFLKIPPDRLDACLEEFKTALEKAWVLKARKPMGVLLFESFKWIDDGKKEANINVEVIFLERKEVGSEQLR